MNRYYGTENIKIPTHNYDKQSMGVNPNYLQRQYMSARQGNQDSMFSSPNMDMESKVMNKIRGKLGRDSMTPYLNNDTEEDYIFMPYSKGATLAVNGRMMAEGSYPITPSWGSQAQSSTTKISLMGYVTNTEFRVKIPQLPPGVTFGGIQSLFKDVKFTFTGDMTSFTLDARMWYILSFGLQDKKHESILREEQGNAGIFDGDSDMTYQGGDRHLRANFPLSFKQIGPLGLQDVGNGIPAMSRSDWAQLDVNFVSADNIYIVSPSVTGFDPLDYKPEVNFVVSYESKPEDWLRKYIIKQNTVVQDSQSAFMPITSKSVLQMANNTDVSFSVNLGAYANKLIKMVILDARFTKKKLLGPCYPGIPIGTCKLTDSAYNPFNFDENAGPRLHKMIRDYFGLNAIDNTIGVIVFSHKMDMDFMAGAIEGSTSTFIVTSYQGKYNNSGEDQQVEMDLTGIVHAIVTTEMQGSELYQNTYF